MNIPPSRPLVSQRLPALNLISFSATALIGFMLAAVPRTVVALGGVSVLNSNLVLRLFTLHANIMMFACLLPGIPGALGRYIVRSAIKEGTFADTKLGWVGFYLTVSGAAVMVAAIWIGRLDTAIAYYLAYKNYATASMVWLSLGILLLGIASAVNAVDLLRVMRTFEFGVEPKRTRAPTLFKLMCFTGWVHMLAAPVQLTTFGLLLMDHVHLYSVFDPAQGGDPVVLRHLFWFYVHPVVVASVLPVVGLLCQLLERQNPRLRGEHGVIVNAGFVMSILAWVGWGTHLVNTGLSPLMSSMFSAMTLLGLVPAGLIVILLNRSFRHVGHWQPAIGNYGYGAGVLVMFSIVVLTTIPLAVLGINTFLPGTLYFVGHLHIISAVVMIVGFTSGLHLVRPRKSNEPTSLDDLATLQRSH